MTHTFWTLHPMWLQTGTVKKICSIGWRFFECFEVNVSIISLIHASTVTEPTCLLPLNHTHIITPPPTTYTTCTAVAITAPSPPSSTHSPSLLSISPASLAMSVLPWKLMMPSLLCGADADSLLTSSLCMGGITIFYCSFFHHSTRLIYTVYWMFTVFISFTFYSIIFYNVLFYSLLSCIQFKSIMFYYILFCSVQFYNILFYSIHNALFYNVLLYPILFCSIL